MCTRFIHDKIVFSIKYQGLRISSGYAGKTSDSLVGWWKSPQEAVLMSNVFGKLCFKAPDWIENYRFCIFGLTIDKQPILYHL